jgi:NAD(P)-dependent dehydrogenase (short-subunit alcohol dehydrogenase family)
MSRELFDLSGRCALVTGASRGIGRAIAIAYAEAGADVAVLARDGDRLADVAVAVEKAGGRAVVLVADVTDRAAVDLAVSSAIERLGHLDIVVNNAGGNRFSMPFVGIRFDGWQKTVAVNLDATVHVCQAVGPHLLERRSGAVVNVASVAGLAAVPLMSHYGAAKAAVLSLTRSLAVEWAYAGVRVNALVPGWVATDLTEFARNDPAIGEALMGRVPMGRWATPEEMTGPALFLASDASSFMTGQELVIDGGLSVT